MTDTCGPTSCAPFAKWDRDLSCWKTSEATSLWALTLSSLTLPQWGGLHDGELCEHPTPGLATSGHDSSSLPTPAAIAGASDLNFQVSGDGRTKPNKLGWAIGEMLPTPRTTDSHGPGLHDQGGQDLRTVVSLLPTPAVNDMGEGKTLEWWDDWAPRQKSADGRPAPHGRSLAIEAQRMLPTPAARDAKGPHMAERNGGLCLARTIGETTPRQSTDGKPSSDAEHPDQLSLDELALPA